MAGWKADLAAVGGCFATTFRAIATRLKFEYSDLDVEAEGAVAKAADGYRFGKIFTGPKLTISSAENRNRALDLLKKTKRSLPLLRELSEFT